MRGSLQDQLLKSGIATEDQLKKNKPKPKHRPKHSQKNSQKSKHNGAGKHVKSGDISHNKTTRPNKQNQQKKQTPAEPTPPTLGKALRTEIKNLLKSNKLNDKKGEIPYNYVIAGQVKRFYINEKQQTELKAGKLVIVNWNTISYLISIEAEQALRKLHPTIEVASASTDKSNNEKAKDADDPYADFEIPDDLSW